jgi:stringent starvation protein B
MVSTKPYFVRAIFDWCVDQGLTPYISVVVGAGTRIPREFVKDGRIVLNIGPDATSELLLENEQVTFKARFNGVVFPVVVPMTAVEAIFARENGQGISFGLEDEDTLVSGESEQTDSKTDDAPQKPPAPGGRPHLTRIK